jgi:SAM-dependent methyltransferase
VPEFEADELARLRQLYEASWSWRLTRPVRAIGRVVRALRRAGSTVNAPPIPREGQVDSWLEGFYGERLSAIDSACANGPAGSPYALFRDLDDDLWALLLTQQYQLYPHIRALLPGMPERALQELWNGASGLVLARQSTAFYTHLRAAYENYGDRPLGESTVLDFGCGWGRLTRFLLRDVAPGRLCACDPVEGILEICRANGIAATFARSEFVPDRVPFDDRFDLVFAFSVFTHLSEIAHQRALEALYQALRPGGILVLTIRPAEYLAHCELMRPLAASLAKDLHGALAGARYLFVPHNDDALHTKGDSDEIAYGETVITMAYVRERWSSWFQLLETKVQLDDLHQVVLTLRRK